MASENDVGNRIEILQRIVSRCDAIINGLDGSAAWNEVLDDFKQHRQRLDDTWQNVSDEKQWFEYRITKLAVMKVMNLIDDYKHDKVNATEELFKLQNPDLVIHADVDNS